MHAHLKTSPSLYEQLEALPEGVTGEILNGQLYTQPRPSGPHVFAASELGYELLGPFERGRGGPGGWCIVQEPELHFLRNTEVDVPDLAGWRKERLPRFPRDHRFTPIPDWGSGLGVRDFVPLDREQRPQRQDAHLRAVCGSLRLAARSRRAHLGSLGLGGRRLAGDRTLRWRSSGVGRAVRGGDDQT